MAGPLGANQRGFHGHVAILTILRRAALCGPYAAPEAGNDGSAQRESLAQLLSCPRGRRMGGNVEMHDPRKVKKLKLIHWWLQDKRAVHESRLERDVTRRYIAALTLTRPTQTGLLKTRVFNRIKFFAHTRSALPLVVYP